MPANATPAGRLFPTILALAAAAALVLGCTPGASSGSPSRLGTDGCVEKYDPQTDYFPDKTRLKYATGFKVEYFKHYKVVSVTNPWPNATEQFRYVLVQCGTPKPAGFDGAQVFTIPAKSFVGRSATLLPHVEALELADRLVGFDSLRSINTAAVRAAIQQNKVAEIGTGGGAMNVEKVLDLSPDLAITHGNGNPQTDVHPKLLEVGIKVAVQAEYMEATPLGRAEWIKFMALFFNREATASKWFEDAAGKYEAMTGRARSVQRKPVVLFGRHIAGVWYVPGGATYDARLLADAGADYLWKDDPTNGSLQPSFEAIVDQAARADIWLWINPRTPVETFDQLLAVDPRYGELGPVKKRRVLDNLAKVNEHGGNDYWEGGVANPHLILADLIKVLHPELAPEHQLVWYRHLK
jgi:iron complex transport system substrate-binding protein